MTTRTLGEYAGLLFAARRARLGAKPEPNCGEVLLRATRRVHEQLFHERRQPFVNPAVRSAIIRAL